MVEVSTVLHREEGESCGEEPMYKNSELIYEALIQTHGVIMISVYTC
jgi:hypothetical protein